MRYWAMYTACTALIVFSGAKLSRYGDILAGKTGLGRTWIGVVLMASVTSLPELVTGLGSVTYAGAPDIAVGDVLGSCAFNLLILALLDVLIRPLPLSTRATRLPRSPPWRCPRSRSSGSPTGPRRSGCDLPGTRSGWWPSTW